MKFLEYKGYLGSIEVDLDEGFVFGKLVFIKDVVSYRAEQVSGLKAAFEAAVDDYLATCAELGDTPDVPCKGTFNVRLGPALHQSVAIAATREDVSLNEWVKQACELKLGSDRFDQTSARRVPGTTLLKVTFQEEQVFQFGGTEDWQTNDKRHVH
jgi:predicted HicB family RNase H-like nuclease